MSWKDAFILEYVRHVADAKINMTDARIDMTDLDCEILVPDELERRRKELGEIRSLLREYESYLDEMYCRQRQVLHEIARLENT